MIQVTIESGRALCLNCGRHRLTTIIISFGLITIRICERCFADLLDKLEKVTY